MADDTNIDEILKSIDALLKEGAPEHGSDKDAGEQSSKRRRDTAINDDEVPTPDMPDASVSVQDEEDEADAPALETIEPEPAEHQEIDDVEQDDQPADTQPEDVPVMDTAAGQALEQGHEVKRIVLSEAMLVQDTPDLPLSVAASEIPSEEVQAEIIVADNVFADMPSSDHVGADDLSEDESSEPVSPVPTPVPDTEAVAQAGQAEAEYEAVANMSVLDMGRMIEQITAEISGRLQKQLPGMVAGLVAEAMEKNLAECAVHGDESINDKQN